MFGIPRKDRAAVNNLSTSRSVLSRATDGERRGPSKPYSRGPCRISWNVQVLDLSVFCTVGREERASCSALPANVSLARDGIAEECVSKFLKFCERESEESDTEAIGCA